MSVRVMTWVWDHSASRGNERLVLLAIADHASDDGSDAWPSIATLARKTGVSERTVQRCISSLVDMGELVVERLGNGRKSSKYRVRMVQGGQSVRGAKSSPRQDVTPDKLSPRQADDEGRQSVREGRQVDTQTVLEPSPEPSTPRPLRGLDAEFDQFWDVYPRREGKAAAKVKFATARKRGIALSVILAGAERYRDDPNREPQYTAHPSTWLNQGRWDDEPLPPRGDRNRANDTPKRPGW